MLLKSFFYKSLNKLCNADITQVLFLDKRTFVKPVVADEIFCRFLNKTDLEALASSSTFGLTTAFIEDFVNYDFRSIAASVDGEIIGIIFLGSGTVPSRHNSGGPAFKGIAVDTPDGVFYLFKVDVLASHRGKRVNAALIAFAVESLNSEVLHSIVTTTDWTNQPFLKSANRLGFVCRGHASEFVFVGKHGYLLPKCLDPQTGNPVIDATIQNSEAIRFRRD
ncbi:MAG: GNAT superfamily N-acetyltransferase [bacterium]|jgi:GNAT superfamily N-acetyltransferase